jgi:hypothetical protein
MLFTNVILSIIGRSETREVEPYSDREIERAYINSALTLSGINQ